MLNEMGGFLGWLIVVAYGLTILNYFVKGKQQAPWVFQCGYNRN